MTITAKCIEACPSHVNIPRYIDYVKDGHPDLAAGVLLHHYPLVAHLRPRVRTPLRSGVPPELC